MRYHLLATKSCDLVDRDAYMWCYSPASVNGVEKTYARYFKKFSQTSRRRGQQDQILPPPGRGFPRYPRPVHSQTPGHVVA